MQRLDLQVFTVYILSGNFDEAHQFAMVHMNPHQPWTWIENADMLHGLRHIHVMRLKSYLQHPDIEKILLKLETIDAFLAEPKP